MILDLLLSPYFVVLYCISIFAIFAYYSIKLITSTEKLRSKLRTILTELSKLNNKFEFATRFEKLNTTLEDTLGSPWKEFVETLIMPLPRSEHLIKNTVEASRYLNNASVIFPKISFESYQSVPNVLTGLGILGTFIGLSAGVRAATTGLASGTPSDMTNSLRNLLDGASLAFFTSIFGVFFSIVFGALNRRQSRRLDLSLHDCVDQIDQLLTQVPPESIALDQLDQLQRSRQQLEKFNTDLVFSIQKALEDQVVKGLAPHFKSLIQAVQDLRSDRSSNLAELIKDTLERFTQELQRHTGDQFNRMENVLKELNTTLERASKHLSDSQTTAATTLKKAMEKITESGIASSEELASKLDMAGTAFTNDIEESASILRTASKSLKSSTEHSETMLTSLTTYTKTLNSLFEKIKTTHQEISEIAHPIRTAADSLRSSIHKLISFQNQMEGFATTLTQLTEQLTSLQKQTTESWKDHSERFKDVDISLKRVFENLQEGIQNYSHDVLSFAKTLDNAMAEAINKLSSANSQLADSIEELIEILPQARDQ